MAQTGPRGGVHWWNDELLITRFIALGHCCPQPTRGLLGVEHSEKHFLSLVA